MHGPIAIPDGVDKFPHVAVALGRPHGGRSQHLAIFYAVKGKGVLALDLNLDGKVNEGPASQKAPKYLWVVPKLHSNPGLQNRFAKQVVGFCRSIGDRPRRFTYAFEFTENTELVSNKKNFFVGGGTEGFTCATFVLAIFQTQGHPLVKVDTWERSDEDDEAQKDLLNTMRKHQSSLGIDDETLQRRAEEIPCLRFSPSAVAGACFVGIVPSECKASRAAGDQALDWLDTYLNTQEWQSAP